MSESKKKQKLFYDRFTENRNFQVGDLVLVKCKPRSPKLLPRFVGPLKVTSVLGNQTYRLENGSVHNIANLKPSIPPVEWFRREEFHPPDLMVPIPENNEETQNLQNHEAPPATEQRQSKYPARTTRGKLPSRLKDYICDFVDSIFSA